MFFNVLEKLSAGIANIIHTTQITFEFIDNVFIIVDLLTVVWPALLKRGSRVKGKGQG